MFKKTLFAVCFCALALHAQTVDGELQRLFLDLTKTFTPESTATIALFPLSPGSDAVPASVGQAVAEYGVVFFLSQPHYKVVERAEFQKIAGEMALSQTGLIADDKAIAAGKALAAQFIVTGSVADAFGKRMISARMINAETGQVVAAAAVTVPAVGLDDLTKDILGERTQVSASVYRSLVGPGWGQFYTGHPIQGSVFLGLTALSAGVLILSITKYFDKSNTVTEFNEGRNFIVGESPAQLAARKQNAVDEKDKAASALNLWTGITVAAWVINVMDAAYVGRKQAKKVNALYFSK